MAKETKSAEYVLSARPLPPSEGVGRELLQPDEDVGQFRVRRLLGEGGMGRVYLARDLVLGRLVALKLIRPEKLSGAGVTKFLNEARMTARFAHPHIVTVYEVGMHASGPYLALEYLDGESLGERLERERPSVDECLRIGRAIADALAHAHEAGVLHCDLKPGNVMIARDGRIRVVDFGQAIGTAELLSSGAGGTPSHMAPEQWLLEPLTDRTDAWALGILLFECFEGAHPFAREDGGRAELKQAVLDPERPVPAIRREGVPSEVERMVRRALSREPSLRPTAAECRAVLELALSPFRGLGTAESPFRGLLPFEERHAQVFFGRETEIAEVVERLRQESIIPVIGASGAGKSSFVHAGIIPRLRAQDQWTVLSLRPGRTPIHTLAHRLLASGGVLGPVEQPAVAELAARIASTPSIVALRLSALAGATRTHVLLVIDQLEELFTLGSDPLEQQKFLEALRSAADDPGEPVRVLFTVRDDFITRVGRLERLFVLSPPERSALRRMITEPLAQVGYQFDQPDLVDTMLAELEEGPGALPLLQFALRELWDARDESRRILAKSVYEKIGGASGALADHADALFASLDPEELSAARQLLLRLVSPESTRRVLERPQLLDGLGAPGERTLARLTDARLLVQSRSRESGEPTIELAHESLIVRWKRLASWLESDREERSLEAELEEVAELWIRRGRREEETWSGEALSSAVRRGEQLALVRSAGVRAFLELGSSRERRSVRRRRAGWTASIATLAALAITGLALAKTFRDRETEARRQRDELVRAGSNLGAFELRLLPFDLDPNTFAERPVEIAALPALAFSLHRGDARGEKLESDQLRVEPLTSTVSTARSYKVEAPGMPAWLEIVGRGRSGEHCAPSWVHIRSLPGFADRKRGVSPVLRVPFPTCQATFADTVEIPAGDFVFGGLGDPPLASPKDTEPERVLALPKFFIDRAEISNARFSAFARLVALSGEDLPNYPEKSVLPHAADPEYPVTGITARTTQAYCEYFGKRLPTFAEWAKVVRGGLRLPDGSVNPAPKRLYPWTGGAKARAGVNFVGAADGCDQSCSVAMRAPEADVYGVRDLVGNVAEWGSGWERPGDMNLAPWMGGNFLSAPDSTLVTSAAANTREPRFFEYGTGGRCVGD